MVTSFVSDIVLPILSLLPFIDRNFDEKFAVLKKGPRYGDSGQGYTTIKLALEDGAVVMGYGYVVFPLAIAFPILLLNRPARRFMKEC